MVFYTNFIQLLNFLIKRFAEVFVCNEEVFQFVTTLALVLAPYFEIIYKKNFHKHLIRLYCFIKPLISIIILNSCAQYHFNLDIKYNIYRFLLYVFYKTFVLLNAWNVYLKFTVIFILYASDINKIILQTKNLVKLNFKSCS